MDNRDYSAVRNSTNTPIPYLFFELLQYRRLFKLLRSVSDEESI